MTTSSLLIKPMLNISFLANKFLYIHNSTYIRHMPPFTLVIQFHYHITCFGRL